MVGDALGDAHPAWIGEIRDPAPHGSIPKRRFTNQTPESSL